VISRRAVGFVAFAIVVSAVCVRLGFWQLHRLGERRALNAMLASRLADAPRPVRDVIRDASTATYRRATATGTYDFANEFALASRTRQGSPGVHIMTPLRIAGTDTAVLVNRGWVYAPDAMTVDFSRWHEPPDATVTGYLLEVNAAGKGAVTASANARVLRRLDRDSVRARLPYPVEPFYVVSTEATKQAGDSTPARLTAPLLDEGPHLGYAFQWFAFALIGLVGAGFSVRADRRGTWRR
jgi:surfeit locus 1 family protein